MMKKAMIIVPLSAFLVLGGSAGTAALACPDNHAAKDGKHATNHAAGTKHDDHGNHGKDCPHHAAGAKHDDHGNHGKDCPHHAAGAMSLPPSPPSSSTTSIKTDKAPSTEQPSGVQKKEGEKSFLPAKPAEFATIRPLKAQEILVNSPNTFFIDVREVNEYSAGHPKGATNRPLSAIESWAPTLDKQAKYILICRSGGRSAKAADRLVKLGFVNVSHVQGGFLEWEMKQLPVQKEGA
ncbi:MAG: rhodanese-like domain-containing protein [Cyanobacteria bacterium NC_groundwater_1444_Ag_S-0.65um_54_12]|nr:rhodanese-like domain-containing protein [Cyanobacteria bacterium NC_groundwater_1444_Ag_S-0.65um_54_12]